MTAQADLYLAAIVTVMFLAGGVLMILYEVNDLRPANVEIAYPAFEKRRLLAMFTCESPHCIAENNCRDRAAQYSIV